VDTIIILTTYPNRISAQKVAHALIDQKLAACVNLLPQMTSIYRWEGQIESGEELQLLIKTRRSLFSEVKNYILDHHPYELPEILCVPILAGSEDYLNWIEKTTHVD
jgi:periplasmic divalent cation tolerance protein